MSPKPLKLRAILFDLDGTCIDSDHIHFECYRQTLLDLVPYFNNGSPISRHYYDTEMSGHQNPALVARLLPHLSLHEQTALWTYKEARYEDIVSRGLSPIPGLKDLLAKCHRKNIATYVVTNSNKKSCLKTMASIGIAQHFSNRVVVAEECNHPKPHPAPYQRALQLAAVDPAEAIAFEDSPSGTTSAKLAGLFTIGIRSTQTDLALRTMGAAFTIPDFCAPELLEALVEMGM